MILINKDKCIDCKACVIDCPTKNIEVLDGIVSTNNIKCLDCGHCVAICPCNAITMPDYNMSEIKEYNSSTFDINSETLMNFIKFRRSVRQFTDKEIDNDKINKIIEAGRFTPTGSNSQNVSYIVIKDSIEELTTLALEGLYNNSKKLLIEKEKVTPDMERFAKRWEEMYKNYTENPGSKESLFFNAKAVIITVSESPMNSALALSNMELMANALGLGVFHNGFFLFATKENEKITNFLNLKDSKQITGCLVLGNPAIKYLRTVPRKECAIDWK